MKALNYKDCLYMYIWVVNKPDELSHTVLNKILQAMENVHNVLI